LAVSAFRADFRVHSFWITRASSARLLGAAIRVAPNGENPFDTGAKGGTLGKKAPRQMPPAGILFWKGCADNALRSTTRMLKAPAGYRNSRVAAVLSNRANDACAHDNPSQLEIAIGPARLGDGRQAVIRFLSRK
jgi:hypothetical protein